jgi:hypothetical protein
MSRATLAVVCTFSLPLLPAVHAVLGWFVVGDTPPVANLYGPTAPPVSLGNQVTFTAVPIGASGGSGFITYATPPATLFGANGLPVAPFPAFPLTVIP